MINIQYYSSRYYKSKRLEITRMPINKGQVKETVAQLHIGTVKRYKADLHISTAHLQDSAGKEKARRVYPVSYHPVNKGKNIRHINTMTYFKRNNRKMNQS